MSFPPQFSAKASIAVAPGSGFQAKYTGSWAFSLDAKRSMSGVPHSLQSFGEKTCVKLPLHVVMDGSAFPVCYYIQDPRQVLGCDPVALLIAPYPQFPCNVIAQAFGPPQVVYVGHCGGVVTIDLYMFVRSIFCIRPDSEQCSQQFQSVYVIFLFTGGPVAPRTTLLLSLDATSPTCVWASAKVQTFIANLANVLQIYLANTSHFQQFIHGQC